MSFIGVFVDVVVSIVMVYSEVLICIILEKVDCEVIIFLL